MNHAVAAVNHFSRAQWIELAVNLAATLWLGSFIAAHVGEPRFLVPAALLDLLVIGQVMLTIRALAFAGSVDFAATPAVVARQLTRAHHERMRSTHLVVLISPIAWAHLVIVGLKGLFGVDAYSSFGIAWLTATLLVGFGFAAAALMVQRRFHALTAALGSSGLSRAIRTVSSEVRA